jgi:hypothetical protein
MVCGPVPRHLRLCAAKLQWFDQGGLNRNDNQENEGAGADRAGGVRARVTASAPANPRSASRPFRAAAAARIEPAFASTEKINMNFASAWARATCKTGTKQ